MSALRYCDEILETTNFKEGKVYLISWFQRFQSMVVGLCCFGPVAAQYIMAGAHGEEACLPYANCEGEREGEEGAMAPKSPSKAYF